MLQTSLPLMKSLNKTEIPFSVCNVFFVSQGNFLDFYLDLHECDKLTLLLISSPANRIGDNLSYILSPTQFSIKCQRLCFLVKNNKK